MRPMHGKEATLARSGGAGGIENDNTGSADCRAVVFRHLLFQSRFLGLLNDIWPTLVKCPNVVVAGDFVPCGDESELVGDGTRSVRGQFLEDQRGNMRVLPVPQDVGRLPEGFAQCGELRTEYRCDGLGCVACLLGPDPHLVPLFCRTIHASFANRLRETPPWHRYALR